MKANVKQAKKFIKMVFAVEATLVRNEKNGNALFAAEFIKHVPMNELFAHAKLALAGSPVACSVKLLKKANFGADNIIEIGFAGNQVRLTKYRGCSEVHIELVDASCNRSCRYKDAYGVYLPISKNSVTH
jgi:hypothetical protein